MDDEIFPDLCLMNTKKTYAKTPKKPGSAAPVSNDIKEGSKPREKALDHGEPLTTKVAVEYLLSGKLKTEVCRYCLKISPGLSELDQIMQIAGTGVLYKITIREMIACFYPFKVNENTEFPESICQRCVDKALNAYLFTQQCEQAERALHNCLIDIDEKLSKLDPIDRPKKRGRQKLKPNPNVLHVENKKVMDYAEPIRHLINLQTESLSNEPEWNEFECKKCWQVLPNLETLLNHEKIHPKTMWYNCRLCGKSFVKLNQLKKHHTQVHIRGKQTTEADKTFKCRECGNVTENYDQHLQHIEKHKFKSVMEHLIEKKTDQLCLICLKKTTDLVELDKMVCIHGSCPELVGDKTLYSVLASTLPDPKSYKYQELHIPQKANIMTITKRKRIYQEPENPKINFNLSHPITVMREKFKTDDFYYYVFCDPDTDTLIFGTDEHNTKNIDVQMSKCIEITDEKPMKFDKDHKSENGKEANLPDHLKSGLKVLNINDEDEVIKMPIDDNVNDITDPNKKSLKEDTIKVDFQKKAEVDHAAIDSNENYYQAHKLATNAMQDIDETDNIVKTREEINVVDITHSEDDSINKQKLDISAKPKDIGVDNFTDKNIGDKLNKDPSESTGSFSFSDPITSGFDIQNINEDTGTMFNFSNPDFENSTVHAIDDAKPRVENNRNRHIVDTINKTPGLDWIFDKTRNATKKEEKKEKTKIEDCKFCWIFSKQNKCEYCKKPINFENNQNTEKKVIQPSNITPVKIIGLKKPTEIKETINQDKQKTWQCNVCLTNNNTDRFTCYCCETKKYFENGNCKVTFGNYNTFFDIPKEGPTANIDQEVATAKIAEPVIIIEETSMMDTKCDTFQQTDNEINAIQNMDVETDSENYNFYTKVTLNEQMDIEEFVPITNVVPTFEPAQILSTNIGSLVGTNIQFNIGSQPVQHDRGGRRIRRAVRNIPKASHK
uniref:RanBP2-type domain-containing protein n=1 Tax=Heliothis virescens TaxID=7102 RepID=A0A2A4K791_HELVI